LGPEGLAVQAALELDSKFTLAPLTNLICILNRNTGISSPRPFAANTAPDPAPKWRGRETERERREKEGRARRIEGRWHVGLTFFIV
jgi:hypothetical protein